MSDKEYITNLETNAMVLGILVISLKDFADQILRQTHNCGTIDDAAITELRELCIRNLKNVEAEGAPLEQEAKALNEALHIFKHLMDDTIARSRA